MACGCKGSKGIKNVNRGSPMGPRPAARQPRIQSNLPPQAPTMLTNTAGASPIGDGLDAERLRVEKIRRDAIKRALNK